MQKPSQSQQPSTQSALLVGPFTAKEQSDLVKLRSQLMEKPQYLDRVLDERRLRFARYLLEHGELSDINQTA